MSCRHDWTPSVVLSIENLSKYTACVKNSLRGVKIFRVWRLASQYSSATSWQEVMSTFPPAVSLCCLTLSCQRPVQLLGARWLQDTNKQTWIYSLENGLNCNTIWWPEADGAHLRWKDAEQTCARVYVSGSVSDVRAAAKTRLNELTLQPADAHSVFWTVWYCQVEEKITVLC